MSYRPEFSTTLCVANAWFITRLGTQSGKAQFSQWRQLMQGMDVVNINSKSMCANTKSNPAKVSYECQLALKPSGRSVAAENVWFPYVVFFAAAANRTKRSLMTIH